MAESPELVRDTYRPEELVRRLQELRRLYQGGAWSAAQFNDFASAFRFNDDVGHLWSLGANTGQWYRWDRTQWTVASPPQSLMLANQDLQRSSEWMITAGAALAATPATATTLQCSRCKKPATSGTFCTTCGGKLETVTTSVPATANVCTGCGTPLKGGAKFCAKCGKPALAPAYTAPQTPACPKCGKPFSPGKKFCSGCGTSLQP